MSWHDTTDSPRLYQIISRAEIERDLDDALRPTLEERFWDFKQNHPNIAKAMNTTYKILTYKIF